MELEYHNENLKKSEKKAPYFVGGIRCKRVGVITYYFFKWFNDNNYHL